MAYIATKSQRHHYVSKFLLKNFVDNDGYLWIADAARQQTYKTTPKKVFAQRDLYVVHDIARSTKTYEYEEMFSKMELASRETLYADPRILEIKEKVESNVHAGFAIGVSDREKIEIERFCSEIGFCVARIVSPRRSFVIGSHGLAIVEAVRQRDTAAGAWFPIAHDVALLVTFFPEKEFFLSLGDQAAHGSLIRRINHASIRLSHMIAGRSDALVCSLMQRSARKH